MSLIEEALKKQQEEFGATGTAHNSNPPQEKIMPTLKKVDPPPPPSPPPLPEAPAKPSSKTLLPVIILVSVCVILLAVTFWLISAGFLKMFMSPKEPQSTPSVATTQVEPPTTAKPPEPPPSQPSLPAAPLNPARVASPTPTVAPPVTTPPPKTTPSPPDTPVPPSPAPPSASPPTPPKTPILIVDTDNSPPTRNPPVQISKTPIWPDINITGIIGADGANGAALINGQLINVGETFQGVTLIAISRNSIKATFEGETRTLKVGGK